MNRQSLRQAIAEYTGPVTKLPPFEPPEPIPPQPYQKIKRAKDSPLPFYFDVSLPPVKKVNKSIAVQKNRDKILSLLNKGETVVSVMKILNIRNTSQIIRIVIENDLTAQLGDDENTEISKDGVVEMYKTINRRQIAKKLIIATVTFSAIFDKILKKSV